MPAPQAFHDAVIWHESRGQNVRGPEITAGANKGDRAHGASQVMTLTLQDPGFGVTPAKDTSPAEVERVGREYRDAMFDRYDGDMEAAAIAYNAGPGNADKWVAAGRDYGALPKPSETRPYAEGINAMIQSADSPVFQTRPTQEQAEETIEKLVPADKINKKQSANSAGKNTDMLLGQAVLADSVSDFAIDNSKVVNSVFGDLYADNYDFAGSILPQGVLPEFAPGNLGEVFAKGFDQGATGMVAEGQRAAAAFNMVLGNQDQAQAFMENARLSSSAASAGLLNVETFGEFLKEPTFDGFVKQAVAGLGQAAPTIITTAGGALISGGGSVVAQLIGKKIASKASRVVTKKLIQEAMERAATGQALKKGDKQIINATYYAFRRGAAAGAFGSEYPIMVGSSFGEFEEAGVELNANRALQSIGIGAPLAAIGVGGEALIVKGFLNAAKRKAASDSTGMFARYAKELAKSGTKGALTEGVTEGIQEGGLVAQRFAVDEDYSSEEAQLRIAQGVFIGAIAGGGLGSAGSILSTSASMIQKGPEALKRAAKKRIAEEEALPVDGLDDKPVTRGVAKALFKAATMVDRALSSTEQTEHRAARLGISDDQFAGVPTVEPTEYLQAQMAALLDPEAPKRGVLYPANSAAMESVQGEEDTRTSEGEIKELRLGEGLSLFSVLTPHGLVFTRTRADAELLLNDGSQEALASVLGFSDVKPEGAQEVVRVVDKSNGGVVSEQLVNDETKPAAEQAAAAYPDANYSTETVPLEQALEERQAALRRSQNEAVEEGSDTEKKDAESLTKGAEAVMNETEFDPDGEKQHVNRLKRTDTRFRDADFEQKFNAFLSSVPEDERTYYTERKSLISDSLLKQMQKLVDERFQNKGASTEADRPSIYMPRIEVVEDSKDFIDFFREPTAPDSKRERLIMDLRKKLLQTARLDVNTGKSKKLRTPIQVTFKDSKGNDKSVNPDMRTLINIARKMNIAEETAVIGEGISPRQSAAMAFQRVWIELNDAGYDMHLQGVPTLVADPSASGKLFETKTLPMTFTKRDLKKHPGMAGVVIYNSNTVNMTYQEMFTETQPRPYEETQRARMEEDKIKAVRRKFIRAVAKIKQNSITALAAATHTNGTNREQVISEIRAELERLREGYEAAYADLVSRSWGESRDNADIEDSSQELEAGRDDDGIRKSRARQAELAERSRREEDDIRDKSQSEFIEQHERQPTPKELEEIVEAKLELLQERRAQEAYQAKVRENKKKREATKTKPAPTEEEVGDRMVREALQDEVDAENAENDIQDPKTQIILPHEAFKTAPTIFSRVINEDYIGWKTEQEFGATPSKQAKSQPPKKVTTFRFIGKPLADAGSRIMGIAKGAFKFSRPVVIIRASELNGTKAKDHIGKDKLFNDGAEDFVNQWVHDIVKAGDRAQVQMGKSAYIVLVNDMDPPKAAKTDEEIDAAYGLAIAHEIGHIHLHESKAAISADRELAQKMWNAYLDTIEKMKADGKTPTQYTEDMHGFDEWFSDQVAAFALEQFSSKKTNKDLQDTVKVVGLKKGKVDISYRANDPALVRKFKDIVSRLESFVKRLQNVIGKRYKAYKSDEFTFAAYMADVKKREKSSRNPAFTFAEDMQTKSMNEAVASDPRNKARARRIERTAKKLFSSTSMSWLKRHLYAADDWFRSLGAGGKELAQWFYGKSQSEESQGFHQRKNHAHNRMVNQILGVLDAHDMSAKEAFEGNQDALLDAADETIDTADLTGVAAALRALLKDWYNDYIHPALGEGGTPIAFRENYFPRAFDPAAIAADRDGFIAFLFKYIGDGAEAVAQTILGDPNPEDDPVGNPAFRNSLQRTLEAVPTRAIIEAGFAVPPGEVLLSYAHHAAKRVEYERGGGRVQMRGLAAGAAGGDVDAITKTYDKLHAAKLKKTGKFFMPKADEEKLWHQAVDHHGIDMPLYWRVEQGIMAQFGRLNRLGGVEINDETSTVAKVVKRANELTATHTILTTLLFAVPASFPDLGGIIMRSKEARHFSAAWGYIMNKEDKAESMELARSIGSITNEELANQFMSAGELDHFGRSSKWIIEKFFKYTLTTSYTNMMRRIASGVGRDFLVFNAQHPEFDSDPRRKRYLDELGTTQEDVLAWVDVGKPLSGPEFDAVKGAMARFVDESIVRPDAAQRPVWASNPWFMALWTLKSYFYAYGKAVVGGIGREIQNRYSETGSVTEAAAVMLLAAGFILPLTMFGLGAREWMKYAGRLVIPGLDADGSVFQSRFMNGPEYAVEIIDRSGIMGPLTIPWGTMQGFDREGLGGPLIANIPALDAIDDTLFDGDWSRPVPVLNNL